MPVKNNSASNLAARIYQTAFDWVRRLFQLSLAAVVLVTGYLLYGLFLGDVSAMRGPDIRILANVDGAIYWLNVALVINLACTCLLFYDEEYTGYALLGGAVALYYGIPILFATVLTGQVEAWQTAHNVAALHIYQQAHYAGLLLGIPGMVLAIRDLALRLYGNLRGRHEEYKYGNKVREEKPPNGAILGALAKCWQLPYCRESFRRNCPIYLNRSRCWRHRVGCMCEEPLVRKATDLLIHKQDIIRAEPLIEGLDTPIQSADTMAQAVQPIEVVKTSRSAPVIPKIPTSNLPKYVKVERCRNCIIYNEHQRMKYQVLAPLVVIGIPALTWWKLGDISGWINTLFTSVDSIMSRLSLASTPKSVNFMESLNSSGQAAQYMILFCVVIIITSMALRFLEYCIFKLKI